VSKERAWWQADEGSSRIPAHWPPASHKYSPASYVHLGTLYTNRARGPALEGSGARAAPGCPPTAQIPWSLCLPGGLLSPPVTDRARPGERLGEAWPARRSRPSLPFQPMPPAPTATARRPFPSDQVFSSLSRYEAEGLPPLRPAAPGLLLLQQEQAGKASGPRPRAGKGATSVTQAPA